MEGQNFWDQLSQTGQVFKTYIDEDDPNIIWVVSIKGKETPIDLSRDYNSRTRNDIIRFLEIRRPKKN